MIELTFTNSGVSFNTKGVADPTINYSHNGDPAESEGFSKINRSVIFNSIPSPADDNYKLQSSSATIYGDANVASVKQVKPSICSTPDTFPVMDANRHTSIHDTAGKPILTPPHSQPPAVSSTYKTGV